MPSNGLRPPPSLPTGDIRAFSKWCREALQGDLTTDVEVATAVAAAVASLTTAYQAADAAHVAASDPHPTYTTAAELSAAISAFAASALVTDFAIGSATPSTTQAANADTSGATLGQLETEVNELKAVLRTFGLIAP